MKDYIFNSSKGKKYITKIIYNKNNNTIEIHYSNKSVKTTQYSIVEFKKLLYLMKEQVLQNQEKYEEVLRNISTVQKGLKKYLCFLIINIITILGLTLTAFMFKPFFLVLALLLTFSLVKSCKKVKVEYINQKNMLSFIEDHEKNMYFLENNDIFSNEQVLSDDALDNVSKSTVTYIISSNLDENIPILNLSSIEDIPQSDLEQIRENITSHAPVLKIKPIKNNVKNS